MSDQFKSKLFTYVKWIGGATLAFFIIYGTCNYLASLNPNRYSMCMLWELKIPFIPWMVIPYRTLDVLLVVVLFWLSEERIKQYGFHMMLSLIPASIIFFFYPGQCGYVRPDPNSLGAFKDIFHVLYTLDKPHNLFPSLHVTYSYLGIKALTEEHSSLVKRALLWTWFILIAASIIFTWQHHLFDLATGFLLGYLVYKVRYEDFLNLVFKRNQVSL